MQTAAQDRLALEMDLKDALDADQFFLLYQPTFDLQSETITGVEALIRWRHPVRGVIAPDTFIPLAEETGLIVPIGRWVLQTACEQAAAWHRQHRPLGISINVSARQLDAQRPGPRRRRNARAHRPRPAHAHARDHRDDADARRRRGRERLQ